MINWKFFVPASIIILILGIAVITRSNNTTTTVSPTATATTPPLASPSAKTVTTIQADAPSLAAQISNDAISQLETDLARPADTVVPADDITLTSLDTSINTTANDL